MGTVKGCSHKWPGQGMRVHSTPPSGTKNVLFLFSVNSLQSVLLRRNPASTRNIVPSLYFPGHLAVYTSPPDSLSADWQAT